jgi:hypothetical protein
MSETTPKRGIDSRVVFATIAGLLISCGVGYYAAKRVGGGGGDPSVPTSDAEAQTDYHTMDFGALPDDFDEAFKLVRAAQTWDDRKKAPKSGKYDATADPRTWMKLEMDSEVLGQSFDLGSKFLVNWQLPEGNFRYMYDWTEGDWIEDDNQVRQAGSLWGVALCHRYRPTPETQAALDKGLRFWFDATIPGPDEGTLSLRYGDANEITSGTIALVGLSIVEYVQSDSEISDEYRAEMTEKLEGYLAMLQWMQLDNGHISRGYYHDRSKRRGSASPYYDGESLLCLCKAARQLGYTDLVPTIEKAARAMAETYTVESWDKDRDSNQTKGFYQWGSMSFLEYYQAQWKDYELFGEVTLALGYWMTHTHHTLKKGRNHAYAVEGLVSAYQIAVLRNDLAAQTDLLYVIDRSLHKLSQWQVHGPLADSNPFLVKHTTEDPLAHGGVMNARKRSGADVKKDVSSQLRIDVTQHQMHAVTMALELVYAER